MRKRSKTQDEFVSELKMVNSKIVVIGTYQNNTTKIKVLCKNHGTEFETTPKVLLRGSGCPKCKTEKLKSSKSMTHKEFIEKCANVKGIEIVGTYTGNKHKILCKCQTCGARIEVLPSNLLRGQGCKICANNKMAIERRKATDEFKRELAEINDNIMVISEYKGSRSSITCKCKIHDVVWNTQPSSLLRGSGCPLCRREKISESLKKCHDDFLKEVNSLHPKIKINGIYVSNKEPIEAECLVDGTLFYPLPTNLLKGQGCPTCGIIKRADARRLTQEEFRKRVLDISPTIKIVGNYVGQNHKIKVKCEVDGYEWETKALHLLNGHGCPKCRVSNGEKEVERFLLENHIRYEIQHTFKGCKNKRNLRFDFYLPHLSAVIEYDGVQHFEPVGFFGGEKGHIYRKRLDEIKNEYCRKNGITLIRVPYTTEDIHGYLSEQLGKIKNDQLELIV